jgi:WD40 repeat protein
LTEAKKRDIQEAELLKEDGIGYFRGTITSYKKWQNSAAKHHDFKGHENAVYSVKLSPCMHYVLSCSEDRTARLWVLKTGQCIKIYRGHAKVVTDCDFHKTFKVSTILPYYSILVCVM